MSVMLIIIAFMMVALIVIRNKVVAIEKSIDEKLQAATKMPTKIVEIANIVRELANAANFK